MSYFGSIAMQSYQVNCMVYFINLYLEGVNRVAQKSHKKASYGLKGMKTCILPSRDYYYP